MNETFTGQEMGDPPSKPPSKESKVVEWSARILAAGIIYGIFHWAFKILFP